VSGENGRAAIIEFAALPTDFNNTGWAAFRMDRSEMFKNCGALLCVAAATYRRVVVYFDQPKSIALNACQAPFDPGDPEHIVRITAALDNAANACLTCCDAFTRTWLPRVRSRNTGLRKRACRTLHAMGAYGCAVESG
jgi:hypothetical protein